MNKQKGFTLVELIPLILIILILVGWVKNIIKLSDCDFEAPYTAEIIHTLGLIPPVGMVTGWIDVGT